MEFLKNVMGSHGKVMEFHFQISGRTVYKYFEFFI